MLMRVHVCVWLHFSCVGSFTLCPFMKRLSRSNCKTCLDWRGSRGPATGQLCARRTYNAIVKTKWCGPSFHNSKKGKEKKKKTVIYFCDFFFPLWGDFIVCNKSLSCRIWMNIWSQYISEINYFWMLAVVVINCTRQQHEGKKMLNDLTMNNLFLCSHWKKVYVLISVSKKQ